MPVYQRSETANTNANANRRSTACRQSSKRADGRRGKNAVYIWGLPKYRRYREGQPVLISVIVTTYDRPQYLRAVLRSLSRQTDRDFETIVADDGSGRETEQVVAEYGLHRVWQRHDGFRAAEIRNRAVANARGEYCVFLDGDCLVRPNFIATHRGLAERGWFLAGKRAFLSREFTERVLQNNLEPELFGAAQWLKHRARRDVNRVAILARLPLGPLRRFSASKWKATQTCNLAAWRSDVERVNGFDARYVGWGLEDSDFVVRLLRAGVRRTSGRFAGAVLHLWHPQEDKRTPNAGLFAATIAGHQTRAACGLAELR
jgi:glycosyltransferase involved in cell wall biosynthesis